MKSKVIQYAQPLVQGVAVPSVMNHGDARHFEPYVRLGSIWGTVGISASVIVGALSVGAESGDPSIHVSTAN